MEKPAPSGDDSRTELSQGWGYVSARVTPLAAGDSMVLPASLTSFVLVVGQIKIDGAPDFPDSIFAYPEAVTIEVPPGARWTVIALTETQLVLYSSGTAGKA
jgi:5-deoxy-D-glucuronate isomerase